LGVLERLINFLDGIARYQLGKYPGIVLDYQGLVAGYCLSQGLF